MLIVTRAMIIKNVAFVAAIFLSSFLGCLFILFPLFLTVFFIKHDTWRYLVDRIVAFWELFPVALLHYFVGVDFRLYGDRFRREDKGVIIMNHRTRLDWLFFWNALCQMDPSLLTIEKISLKTGLKNVLGAGWAMECNSFIFLDRDWTKDETLIRDMCEYYASTQNYYQILIFPEGTDYCEKSVARSQTYSNENNLPCPTFVLQPRTSGFVHLVTELLKYDNINCIYDVTIGYPDAIVQAETDFLLHGQCPKRVDFSIKRYSLEDIPKEDDKYQFAVWCRKVWLEKDKMLASFYEPKEANDRGFHQVPAMNSGYDTRSTVVMICALMFWIFSVSLWVYMIWVSFYVKVYAFCGFCVFMILQKFFGGIEKVAIRWRKR